MNKTRNKLWGFFRAYNCYIQRLYVFNKIRVHVTGWQFINVERCFIKLFCWIKICFLFKNALLIKRYSYVPTKHNFLPTTNPLHLNFLLMSASYIWSDSKTRRGLLFTTTLIVLRNLTFIVIYILKENTRTIKRSKSQFYYYLFLQLHELYQYHIVLSLSFF